MKRIVVLVSVCFLIFCASFAGADEAVLAKIGDKTITKTDFDRLVGYYPDARAFLEQSPQNKATLLRRIVQAYVLADIARKAGFDKRPEIREQEELLANNFLAMQYIKIEVSDKITVTDEDVRRYYEQHQEEFRVPERVKASHILIRIAVSAPEDEKKKAREKAEGILKKIKGGDDFAKLASEFSDDPGSKARGGDLGFFGRGMMAKPFEDAAFSLKPGEVSDLVETQFGYHIIKVEEKTEAQTEPFETVKEKVRAKALEEARRTKVNEFIEKALKDSGAEMNAEMLTGDKKK